jgi:uncharacterized protein
LEIPGHLIVDVARLDRGGESFTGETGAEVLELEADAIRRPVGGIAYSVHVEQVDHELLVRGRVSQRFRCVCSRCAEPFDLTVAENAFFADFPVEEGVEFVDLTPDMREAIILALPGYPVCREECRGLCARCGANLNREACSCGPAAGEGPWAALDLLGKKK